MPMLDLDADEADLPIYDLLHQATAHAARPILLHRLTALTADSAARLHVEGARALQRFLEQPGWDGPDEGPAHPHAGPDDAAWVEVGAELARHLASARVDPAQIDATLADDLAAELAATLWSSLLDHALPAAQADGRVGVQDLVPDRSDPSAWLTQLCADLKPFSLSADQVLHVLRASLLRLAGQQHLTTRLHLPMGLWLDPAEVLQRLKGEPSPARPQAAGTGPGQPTLAQEFSALSTSQFAGL